MGWDRGRRFAPALVGLAALGVAVVGSVAVSGAPAAAADEGPVLAGTYDVQVEIVSSDLPAEFEQRSGERTYWFAEPCSSDCKASRTNQDGDRLDVAVTGEGGTFSWTSSSLLDCNDTVTGELTTPEGASFGTTATFEPTSTVERDGVTYVEAFAGTFETVLEITPAGLADGCDIQQTGTTRASATATITGTVRPLSSQLAVESGGAPDPSEPLARAAGAAGGGGAAIAAGEQAIGGFTLPLTAEQREARRAVARGTRSQVPASVVLPGDVVGDSSRLLQNLLLAALLGLLMVFPSELFNKTYDENHDRVDAVLARAIPGHRRRMARAAAMAAAGAAPEDPDEAAAEAGSPDRAKRTAAFAAVALAGAVIGGFLDPKFGLTAASVTLVIGVLVSIVFGSTTSIAAGRSFRRAIGHDRRWYLEAIPSGLLVAVVCVLISRLTGFAPGYLYGLVGGASFLVALERRDKGRAALVGVVVTLAIAAAAWLLMPLVSGPANEAHPAPPVLIADSLLGGLFIGGLEGVLLSLVPIKFFPGHAIKSWSWWAWIPAAAVVTVTFVQVLLRPDSGYLGRSTTASVTVTVALFVGFGVASIAFWLWFRLRPTTDPAADPPAPEPGAVDLAGAGS